MSFDLVRSADGFFRTFPWPIGKIFGPFFFAEKANLTFLNQLEADMTNPNTTMSDLWYNNLFASKLKFSLFDVLKDIADDNSDRMNRIMRYGEYSFVSNVHSVIYLPNGAAVTGTPPVDPNEYTPTSNVTVLGNTGAMVNGTLVFNGWNTAADGSGTSFPVGSTLIMGKNDVNLYAMWLDPNAPPVAKPVTYTQPNQSGSNSILAIGNLIPSANAGMYQMPMGGYFAPTETDELMYNFEYPRTWAISNIIGPYKPMSYDVMLEANLDIEASFANDFSANFNGDMDNGDLDLESYHAYFDSGAWNAFQQIPQINPFSVNNPTQWDPNSPRGRNAPPQLLPLFQMPTGWTTYPPGFIRNDPIANGYWIFTPTEVQVTLPRSMLNVTKFLSPNTVNSIVSIFFLFYQSAHQAIYPEFAGVSQYLLGLEPSRRNISLMDRIGVESTFSPQVLAVPNPVSATTVVPTAPTQTPTASGAPTNLTASPSDSMVTLSWTPVSGVIGYNIYRSIDQTETGSKINLQLLTTTTFIDDDPDLQNGQDYYYRVTSIVAEQDVGDYFDPTDSIVEDTSVIQEFLPSFLAGSVCESNVQTWIRAIKNFVAQNPNLFTGQFNIPAYAVRTATGYDPTPMVSLWKTAIQAIELLFGFSQELMMTQTRFTKRYGSSGDKREFRRWRP